MKQVVQGVSGGPVRVLDVPPPTIGPTEVLVQTLASVLSPGTERAVTALARSSLVGKARARPDLVRQVVRKARRDGLAATARSVRARLDDDVPLGYSAAGIALEVGQHVAGVSPGQLVATGGAGKANHAEFQAVPGLLTVPVPPGVSAEDAAFATLASVALHGLRLTEVGAGAKVVVVGLGLLGQLAVRLARAAGCDVVGIDLAELPIERAKAAGALALREEGDATTDTVLAWARHRGADAVLLTAATASSDVVRRVPALCRDRASVVVVGDVGLDLERTPFYGKELSLRFARSYGPGRYDPSYEEWGVDYPAGHVRWTEGRNLEAVLDLLASGRLTVGDLVTQRYPIAEAAQAYELIETGAEPSLGVVLQYPDAATERQCPIRLRQPAAAAEGEPGVGLIGAGAFASTVLVPALKAAGFTRLVAVASASGLSARRLAERAGFEKALSGGDTVIDDPDVDVVVIATPHATHAALAAKALRAGKHVFCEKPLALTLEELDDVETAWHESNKVLFVGFNRRYSQAVRRVRDHFAGGTGPLVITYRVNAGEVPKRHWYVDRRQGGRLLGEVCHFIDTCGAIVGDDTVQVRALGSGEGERGLPDDVVVSLRYPNGSLAAITYSSAGPPCIEKERVTILGRGHSAEIRDFATVRLDKLAFERTAAGKGHQCLIATFRNALHDSQGDTTATALASSRATVLAAAQLLPLR